MIHPSTCRISQKWANPYAKVNRWGHIGHNGIDYATTIGTKLKAPISGILSSGYEVGGYGYYAKIVNQEYIVILGHLKSNPFLVAPGSIVREGQEIVLSGNTGNSTGPHVHFDVRPRYNIQYDNGYGGRIDPIFIINSTHEKMRAYVSPGVVVDTKFQIHPNIGYANVLETRNDGQEVHIRTHFPDGVLFDRWVDAKYCTAVPNDTSALVNEIKSLKAFVEEIKKAYSKLWSVLNSPIN